MNGRQFTYEFSVYVVNGRQFTYEFSVYVVNGQKFAYEFSVGVVNGQQFAYEFSVGVVNGQQFAYEMLSFQNLKEKTRLTFSSFEAHSEDIMRSLFCSREFADVSFFVDGQNVKAHKAILAASSEEFRVRPSLGL